MLPNLAGSHPNVARRTQPPTCLASRMVGVRVCAGAAVHAMASTGAGLHVSGSWRACATSVRTIFKPMNSNELLLLSTLVPLHLSDRAFVHRTHTCLVLGSEPLTCVVMLACVLA